MGGRGTYSQGKNPEQTYKVVGEIYGVKVLVGTGHKHQLPEESRTAKAYIKLLYFCTSK